MAKFGHFSHFSEIAKKRNFRLKIGAVRVFYGLTVNSLGDFLKSPNCHQGPNQWVLLMVSWRIHRRLLLVVS